MTNLDKDGARTPANSNIDTALDVVASKDLEPAEKVRILQELELDARLMDVAVDEGMSTGEERSNKAAPKSPLPEIKKAQRALGAEPIPDEGSPTSFTP